MTIALYSHLLSRVDIVQVIDGYVPLTRSGAEYRPAAREPHRHAIVQGEPDQTVSTTASAAGLMGRHQVPAEYAAVVTAMPARAGPTFLSARTMLETQQKGQAACVRRAPVLA
jgi:hypothetical protein